MSYELRVWNSAAGSVDELIIISRHDTLQDAFDYRAKANNPLDRGTWHHWCIVEIDESGAHIAEYEIEEDGSVLPLPYLHQLD